MLVLRPDAGELGRLYPWLHGALAGIFLLPAVRHAMHVCLEEAVANAIGHGGSREPILISLAADDREVRLIIEDAGIPFDPAAARPRRTAALEPGGTGLVLLHHFCPALRYQRHDGRNRLILPFPRGASGGETG